MSSRVMLLVGLLLSSQVARAELVPELAPSLTVSCDDFDLPSLVTAIEREAAVLDKSSMTLPIGALQVRGADYAAKTLRPLAAYAKAKDLTNLCGALQYNYEWRRVGPGHVTFTAYHTPTVKGSLTRDETYRFPLYRRPKDAGAKATTAQILAGALDHKDLEIVWLADAYDALALQVEGAGEIELPTGAKLALGADGNNGQPYQNVSKLLQADGRLPPGPAPATQQPGNPKARAYFTAHPAELNVYWGKNAHFVFFKKVEKAGGGKFGPLVAGRSVAVDTDRVPMGALLFVEVRRPVVENGAVTGWTPMSRVMMAQDTGAGIKGSRMDLFFGEDEYARVAAQTMTVQGDAWVLMAR
jgi:membrane-bound lytic murein transglycosylase A